MICTFLHWPPIFQTLPTRKGHEVDQPPASTPTILERVADGSARAFASRISRRSFFGRLGRGVVAVSLGSAGAQLLRPTSAYANHFACPPGCQL